MRDYHLPPPQQPPSPPHVKAGEQVLLLVKPPVSITALVRVADAFTPELPKATRIYIAERGNHLAIVAVPVAEAAS